MHSSNKTAAFTLIELSIVLVIIGLIAGGVLVGKDLIHGAKIRSQISQIEKINTAVITLRLKYNCLPGDCPNAVDFGLGTLSHHNGGGNRLVNAPCTSSTHYSFYQFNREADNFFFHLTNAELFEGDFEGYGGEGNGTYTLTDIQRRYPKGELDNSFIFPSKFSRDSVCQGAGTTTDEHIREGGNGYLVANFEEGYGFRRNISTDTLRSIDEKIDDGLPMTGKVGTPYDLRYRVNAATNVDGLNNTMGCTTAGANAYPAVALNCGMVFLNQFE